MKQALKAAGTAALGIAIAAVGAGTASADAQAPVGVALPGGTLTNPAVTGTVADTTAKLPSSDKVTGTLGTLAPTAGQAAPGAETRIAGVTDRTDLPNVPGVDKASVGGLTTALPLPGLTV
ncbi:ATP-binding protein [Streptomyces kaniharaensis]|uniref:ATP-binding protein n=1 Tax=Streptomyces kaniharaensis TaxID=212423 RepID=UPI0018A873C2|nr:ATP-binding protein [Streptomyces kaniharaensis]